MRRETTRKPTRYAGRQTLLTLVTGLWMVVWMVACQPVTVPPDREPSRTGTPVETATTPVITSAPTRQPSATPTPASTLEASEEDLEGISIQFWHPWSGRAEQVIGQLIDQFNRTNPWQVTAQPMALSSFDALSEQIATSLETKALPELVIAYSYQALEWEAGGLGLADIERYIQDPVWGFSPVEQADFPAVFWQQDVVEGRRIGVPAWRSAQLLFYNQSWARELGFNRPPSTPAEFRAQVCAAAQAANADDRSDNNGQGGWRISTDYGVMLSWLGAYDAQIWDAQRARYQFDSSQTEASLRFLRELYEAGCAWLPEDELPFNDFAARRSLIAAGNLVDLSLQEAAMSQAGNQDRWLTLAFPGPQESSAINVYGPAFVIPAESPAEQLASWLVIKWLLQPDHQAELVAASGTFVLRSSARNQLGQAGSLPEQWEQAIEWLPSARPEPTTRSWGVVRWTLSDVGTQLYRWYFTLEQLPDTLELWDETAAELLKRNPNPDE